MPDSTTLASGRRSIASLDGLRALSIMLVLFGHLYGTAHYPQNSVTRALGEYAHLGVQIFFVISGFLITTLLLKEKAKTGTINLAQFYLRRTFRIFPAAFFYVTVMAIVVKPGYLAYAYTYTMCYASQARPWVLGHLWSLSVEEQFYLVWPAALIIWFKSRQKVAFAVLLLAPLARLLFWLSGMREIDEYFPAVADSLMMGCLLAFYRDSLRTRCKWLMHSAGFAGLGALTLLSPYLLPRVRLQIFFGGVIPLIIALFLFVAVERADWILNNAVTRALGILSYSLYLWQQPFINRHAYHWWTAFPVNLVLALACATGSYWLIERPFLEYYHSRKTIALG